MSPQRRCPDIVWSRGERGQQLESRPAETIGHISLYSPLTWIGGGSRAWHCTPELSRANRFSFRGKNALPSGDRGRPEQKDQ